MMRSNSVRSSAYTVSGICISNSLLSLCPLAAFSKQAMLRQMYAPRPFSLPVGSSFRSPSGVRQILRHSFLGLDSMQPIQRRMGSCFTFIPRSFLC